ncbi:MAG: TRAFAC clade GTPase domain-containing protein [Bacteroidia bacterium]
MIERNILLVGLPETGKTSFLAGFYHLVSSAEMEGKTLSQYKISKDNTYLNLIHEKWLQCETLQRTLTVTGISKGDVVMHIKDERTQDRLDLKIPDIAGESFNTHFADRIWELKYREVVNSSSGILLFINPSKVLPHVLIDEISAALDGFNEDSSDEVDGKNSAVLEKSAEFDIEKVPSQVVLLDIIDSHLEEVRTEPQSIAIVISAWDEIIEQKITPEKWLEMNLPLVFQFLICNFERISFKVFGVSAQGGSYKEMTEKLLQHDEPAQKIVVQEGEHFHNNICAPIEWIIEQW